MLTAITSLALLFPPSLYTAEDRARAERVANMSRFVGPKLPPKEKEPPAIHTSDSEASKASEKPTPSPKRPSRPSSPPRERFYIHGNTIRNSSGGVVAQFGACRSCAQVRAGIRIRRR